ncbi:MAG: PqqD family peptide modification chaperone, partial [Planctomycetota bacterium]
MDNSSNSPNSGAKGIRIPPDLRLADFGGEGTLAFRLSDRVPRILNPAAAKVMFTLHGGASPREAAEALRAGFGIDLATADADVDALLKGLVEEGLIGLGDEARGLPPLPAGWEDRLEAIMAETTPSQESDAPPPPEIPGSAMPFRTDADVILREEEEGAFLFEPESGELSCLNPVGIRVWKAVDGKTTLDVIVDALAAEFGDV